MDTQFFDALVIGAGIAGATAGAHLSATHKVALIEAEESAGYHTTGRSAAIWILSYGSADAQILTA
uniref:FAD-dependent oxidoreductase n=1 Tax=Roseococcus sp. TaxID=2109646 RepID=UPI003BAAB8AB